MDDRDRQIIDRIRSEIKIISEMLDGIDFDDFVSDEKTRRAVCMTLINIGELVKNLTDKFKEKNNDIKWRDIAGLRDITAHKYQTLRIEDIWETIKQDIPVLCKQTENLKFNGSQNNNGEKNE